MRQYHEGLEYILKNGVDKENRTGVDTRSVFGYQMRFDLQEGFPVPTTKKFAMKPMVSELIWFLEGSTDERRLAEILHGKPREELIGKTTIWTANADKQGVDLGYENTDLVKELGPVYGSQWRNWNPFPHDYGRAETGIDQIAQIVDKLKNNPNDRRIILSAWNVADIEHMALPPCHCLSQFAVNPLRYGTRYKLAKNHSEQAFDEFKEFYHAGKVPGKKMIAEFDKKYSLPSGELSCLLYQRSADFFLGSPFNIASYSLLTHMLAQVTGLVVGEFIYTMGDMHLYHNHFEQVEEQLSRKPFQQPELWLNPEIKNIDDFTMDDIKLIGYESHPAIKAPMAV